MRLISLVKYTMVAASFAMVTSCDQDDDKLGASILKDTLPYAPSQTDFWLKDNFELPYNIEVLYRWDAQFVDYNKYLFPPDAANVQPAMEIVKKLWIDTYSTVGGKNFIKQLAPREIVMIGGVNKNTTGTTTLGYAEAGSRITLFETDNLVSYIQNPARTVEEKKAKTRVFIQTIQHEYIHILNQTKPYDRKTFEAIVKNGGLGQYKSDWYSDTDAVAREKGYITNYSQSNVDEDFAEMASFMLVFSKPEYDAIVAAIKNEKARQLIKAKEQIVVAYYKEQFNIDFYALVEEANKNSQLVFNSFNKK